VIWDEYDPLALDLLEARPDDEPLAEAFRAVIRETLGGLHRRDPGRVRLSLTVPELRARFLNEQTQGVELLMPMLAKKRGAADELRLRVIGTALLAAVSVALDLWQKSDDKRDLLALLDQATDALAEGMHELKVKRRRSR
jgi:MftR C-terminal domain